MNEIEGHPDVTNNSEPLNGQSSSRFAINSRSLALCFARRARKQT